MKASKLRLFHQLQLAAHRLGKAADREVTDVSGLTTAQSAVLSVLANFDDVTQKKVATELGLNESAVTAMVTRLLRLDLITRERSPDDPRRYILHMTKKGEQALAKIKVPFRKLNKRIETVLSPDEIDVLARCLVQLNDEFSE